MALVPRTLTSTRIESIHFVKGCLDEPRTPQIPSVSCPLKGSKRNNITRTPAKPTWLSIPVSAGLRHAGKC
eukprot:6917272-Pyramimonas_sp.AAC.1